MMLKTSPNIGYIKIGGLSKIEVERSRKNYGANVFTKQKRRSFFMEYIESFGDPIIKILMAALAINIIIMFKDQNWFETVGIAIAVFLATFVSTLSEYGSESAFIKLQQEAEKLQCRVRRFDGVSMIPISDIVVGDIVLLQSGEKVPADGILISGELQVDQSSINGESLEVTKIPLAISEQQWNPNVKNQLFRGTIISSGEGTMIVRHVGDNTLYGHIAKELQTNNIESPMKLKLAQLAKNISRIGYTAAILIAFVDLFRAVIIDNGYNLNVILNELQSFPAMLANLIHAALLAISIVVVAVPEGLPMMITVVLSSNMIRMQKNNVMVRKLIGIETSGHINILFSDKTGTLTIGNLAVNKFYCGDGIEIDNIQRLKSYPELCKLISLSCIYNNSSSISSKGAIGGNSTDRALLSFCEPLAKQLSNYTKVKNQPFNSSKKYSWERVHGDKDIVLVKGAPEKLLPFCTGYYDKNGQKQPSDLYHIRHQINKMTDNAVRVLLLATSDKDFDDGSPQLTVVALAGLSDSLRPDVKKAVKTATIAGVQTVMITGDSEKTAISIAREAGILTGNKNELVLTSDEMAKKSDSELRGLIPRLRVVARALPTDKSRLVKLSQDIGLVVGMTGDGINDAPALKKADVGFAMGGGTEIAKEAGDIVILDNNFASITKAILYGRTIFNNIRKFLLFQLTMNVCAVGVSLIGPFIGIDTPVTVIQMLWINIIMDTLAGLAFAGEAPQKEFMKLPPKSKKEPILNKEMMEQIVITGCYTVLLCVLFLKLPYFRHAYHFEENFTYFMTAFFTLFIFAGICNAFNCRTHRINLLSGLPRNPSFILIMGAVSIVQVVIIFYGGEVFRTHPMNIKELHRVLLLAFTVIPFDIIRKIITRLNKGHAAT